MKKFQRHKTSAEIRKQCKEAGVIFDTTLYDEGSDIVIVRSKKYDKNGTVLFNVATGYFFGTTPEGIDFSSDDKRDKTPWFDALLNFFYVGAK